MILQQQCSLPHYKYNITWLDCASLLSAVYTVPVSCTVHIEISGLTHRSRSLHIMPPIPLRNSHFTLDVSGIAGFLGASQAISGMESVHFYKYRQFLGFHNTPGSYNTAQHYGKIAQGPMWDGLFPGNNDEPAILLGLDGKPGPKYRSIASGTEIIDIGHVGYILSQFCRWRVERKGPSRNFGIRETKPTDVTIVQLREIPPENVETNAASDEGNRNEVDPGATNGTNTNTPDATNADAGPQNVANTRVEYPANIRSSPWTHAVALFASLFSIAGCVVCSVYGEWFAFALILLGIVCNGIACLLIGTAQIFLRHPRPSRHSPPGDGLLDDGEQFIVLKGCEEAINYVVKGRIIVQYGQGPELETRRGFHRIGVSAALLTIQFIAQLFIIPRSRLFGQIIFLSTLAVSWLSNCCLSSINKEELQMRILLHTLPFLTPGREDNTLEQQSNFTKFTMPTRTSAVVFAMLCALPMKHFKDRLNSKQRVDHIRGALHSSLPKNTPEWDEWMEHVPIKLEQLLWTRPNSDAMRELASESGGTTTNRDLLQELINDADYAYTRFMTHMGRRGGLVSTG